MPTIRTPCLAFCLIFSSLPALPASATTLTIQGNEASAALELPGGFGAELTIRFESAVGLSASSLGVSAATIDPTSPALAARLPSPTGLSIPAELPLLITIAAPPEGGLAFEGIVALELYTRNLTYTAGTPLRLFSSSDGQPFRDITDEISGGSYRVRGSSGQFSDFLIVADARPLSEIVDAKFARLESLLSVHAGAIGPVLSGELNLLLTAAYTSWQLGDPGSAIDELRAFGAAVEAAAEAGVLPGVWHSSRDVVNVAGMLGADARTLRFSLGRVLAAAP